METTVKKILVPTDLTDKSLHVLDYATDLAKFAGAQIVLLHAYHVPTVVTDVTVVMPSLEDVENGLKEDMDVLADRCALALGSRDRITTLVVPGFVQDEVKATVKKLSIDLVVMGVLGGGFLDEHLFSSNTVSIMKDADTLVLSVPKECKFGPVKHLALASDFSTLKEDKRLLERFLSLVKLFEAHVYLVHIGVNDYVPDGIEAAQGLKLDTLLETVPHTFHHYSHGDVVQGMNEFTDMYHVDMVAMIPHKHSFSEALFHGSNTRKMAFHGRVPLLVLPLG